jgi:protein-S-isoprenylcysteine O-methyltransferase Ste14
VGRTKESTGYLLDQLERALVLAFYAWMLTRFVRGFVEHGYWDSGILIVSEGMAVLFLLIRRPARSMGASLTEWGVATGATLVVLLVSPGAKPPLGPPVVGQGLLLLGLLWQLYAKAALGRSFGMIPANRGVVAWGPYRWVRHPIYAGYLLCHLGFLYLNPTLHNAAVYVVFYSLQIPRLFMEERLLARDPGYRQYQATVRHRLIPPLF